METIVTPLVIPITGIICSTVAVIVYRCIFLKRFVRSQREQHNDDVNNHTENNGVKEEILEKIPVFSISTQTPFFKDHDECSICLALLEDGDQVRLLPSCNHAFHRPCIDAWFMDHANCPVCRSQITCDHCKLPVPVMASENVGAEEQRISHVQGNNINNNNNNNIPNDDHLQLPRPVLVHSVSLSSYVRKKPRALIMGLQRSLSLDQWSSSNSYIAITIQRDEGEASTSASSTREVLMSQRNYRHLDHLSSVLMRSLSQFQNNGSGKYSATLPN
ncbi:hypothetical protein RJT34_19710 [Clitoria ternatea]|uniref:RING-type E3 ubiquitin transferase n=1 Tax=Clitoria ternatea TaxID=43366 RepID=A0AAN9IRU4_CLITE